MGLALQERDALNAFSAKLRAVIKDPGLEVRLFGSKARGDDRPESDIDVLVVESTGDWHVADTVYRIATEVLLDTGVPLSPKVIGRTRYLRLVDEGSPFVANVLREGVPA